MNIARKSMLLAGTVMTPSERRLGRYLRAPEGHESSDAGNNSQGNSGGTGGEPSNQNNAGNAFDPASFWNSEEQASGTEQPGGQPATPPTTPPQQQQEAPNPGQTLAQTIASMKFGDVMTADAASKLAEGDATDFHANLNTALRGVMQQTLVQSVGIMRTLREQIMGEVRQEMQGSFQGRENDSELVKAFPSAADPAVKPIVKSIFDRAMQVTKNNRSAAIDMTREMLKFQSNKMSSDLGIPPASSGDSRAQVPSNVNWADELGGLVGRE